jgi:ribosomal protein S18 acetylase RimI-like enzyme
VNSSPRGGVAKWLCSGLQSRLRRFDSGPRLQTKLPALAGFCFPGLSLPRTREPLLSMQNLTLRPATPSDLPEIMRLERAGFTPAVQESEATFANRIATFAHGCLVLSDPNGELNGYLCAELWPYSPEVPPERFARDHSASATHYPDGDEIYISSMVIDPKCRGMGLANRLFAESLAYIRHHYPKVHSAILIVHPDWHDARRIYRSNAFVEIGTIENYFAATNPAIMMRAPGTAWRPGNDRTRDS